MSFADRKMMMDARMSALIGLVEPRARALWACECAERFLRRESQDPDLSALEMARRHLNGEATTADLRGILHDAADCQPRVAVLAAVSSILQPPSWALEAARFSIFNAEDELAEMSWQMNRLIEMAGGRK